MSTGENAPLSVMPDPSDIARRASGLINYPRLNPDIQFPAEPMTEVYFDVVNDRTASRAAVIVHRSSRPDTAKDGQLIPGTSNRTHGPVGHYDPVSRGWKLYPEFVTDAERPGLRSAFEELAEVSAAMLQTDAECGLPYVDMHDPLTAMARTEMANLLMDTGVAKRLIDDLNARKPEQELTLDEYTSYTLGLSSDAMQFGVNNGITSLEQAEEGQEQRLAFPLVVAYQGILLITKMRVCRTVLEIPVASASMYQGKLWIPDRRRISTAEWDALSGVPSKLDMYKKIDPDFSPAHCAVVR